MCLDPPPAVQVVSKLSEPGCKAGVKVEPCQQQQRSDVQRAAAMPRYYCDYCDTYLTHDSVRPDVVHLTSCPHTIPTKSFCVRQPVVRKQHNTGYKHKANVRNYYMQFEEAQTQNLIDSKIMEYESRSREAFQAQVWRQSHTKSLHTCPSTTWHF